MILAALSQNTINLVYAVSAILLCLGIKRLSSPATARSGNLVAAAGMTLAVVFTLFSPVGCERCKYAAKGRPFR